MRFKLKRRLLFLGIAAAGFIVAYSAGAVFPLGEEESAMVREQFNELIKDIDQFGIFINNFWITLVMFIPGVGAAFGGLVGFQTGVAYGAIVDVNPGLDVLPPQTIFLLPHGAMELFVYGLAISRSSVLMYRLAKDKPWRADQRKPFYHNSLVPTFIEIGIAAAVLFAAALIEWALIETLGGLDTTTLMPT